MLVSTTVVSTRRRRPRTTRRSRPRATSRATTSLSTGSSNTWANRISVLASGTRSPSMRQKARYTKLPRTSRSHSSKVQSWRCLRTSIRRTTAAGVPNRPRRRLCGWRWAKASATRSTRTSSSRRASICRRVESQSLSASGRSTSTRLRCRYARRTMAPPVRPPGLRGAPRELRSRATCEIALLPHHHASRVPSSTNNCAFGWVFRAAARTNTGCPRPNSHREVASGADHDLDSPVALAALLVGIIALGPFSAEPARLDELSRQARLTSEWAHHRNTPFALRSLCCIDLPAMQEDVAERAMNGTQCVSVSRIQPSRVGFHVGGSYDRAAFPFSVPGTQREPHWNVTLLVPSELVTMLDVIGCEPYFRQ